MESMWWALLKVGELGWWVGGVVVGCLLLVDVVGGWLFCFGCLLLWFGWPWRDWGTPLAGATERIGALCWDSQTYSRCPSRH